MENIYYDGSLSISPAYFLTSEGTSCASTSSRYFQQEPIFCKLLYLPAKLPRLLVQMVLKQFNLLNLWTCHLLWKTFTRTLGRNRFSLKHTLLKLLILCPFFILPQDVLPPDQQEEGEVSKPEDQPDQDSLDSDKAISEDQNYRKTVQGVIVFMGWSHILDLEYSPI